MLELDQHHSVPMGPEEALPDVAEHVVNLWLFVVVGGEGLSSDT